MNEYRIYVMSHEGHIKDPPEIVAFATDAEAIANARTRLDGQPIEIWLGPRRVGRLDPDDL